MICYIQLADCFHVDYDKLTFLIDHKYQWYVSMDSAGIDEAAFSSVEVIKDW